MRGDVHVVLVLLLVQRERVHLGEGHAAALSRRRQEQIRGGLRGAAARPRPRGIPGRRDGVARGADVPGDPNDDTDAVPGTWKRMACSARPDGDGEPPRDAGFGFERLGGDRVDGETGGSSTAASREVSKSNGSGLDLARLLEVDLGFGCGSPGTADAGPLASRAWKSRAAGEDPGGSASEPPLVAPVPLPETSSAPFLNPPKPAWRCAFPLRS